MQTSTIQFVRRRRTMYLKTQETLYCRIPVTHMGCLTEIRGRSASIVVVVVFAIFLVYYCSLVACAAHVFGKTADDTQFGRIGTVFSQLFSLWEYFVCKWVKCVLQNTNNKCVNIKRIDLARIFRGSQSKVICCAQRESISMKSYIKQKNVKSRK